MKAKFLVVIDNDECIGSFPGLAALFTVFLRCGMPPPVQFFVQLMTTYGCIRPGVREMFDDIVAHRRAGVKFFTVMCTAASNGGGWVTFLRHLLEAWYGGQVYDHVVDRTMLVQWHNEHKTAVMDPDTGWIIKDMNLVRAACGVAEHVPVVMVDDRPMAVCNAHMIVGVAKYCVPLDVVAIMEKHVPWWTPALHAVHGKSLVQRASCVGPLQTYALDHGTVRRTVARFVHGEFDGSGDDDDDELRADSLSVSSCDVDDDDMQCSPACSVAACS